ncbi:MAG TPA: hypothetical protein VG845_04730 [Dehalococcoidia bacterium]|nr:hypothetical protein [Dehalococcoidia bacterium]
MSTIGKASIAIGVGEGVGVAAAGTVAAGGGVRSTTLVGGSGCGVALGESPPQATASNASSAMDTHQTVLIPVRIRIRHLTTVN